MPHPGELLAPGPAAVLSVALGASPASYAPLKAGTVYVTAGTVSKIDITRGATTTTLGPVAGAFRLSRGDTLTVTYVVVPTSTIFVPD